MVFNTLLNWNDMSDECAGQDRDGHTSQPR